MTDVRNCVLDAETLTQLRQVTPPLANRLLTALINGERWSRDDLIAVIWPEGTRLPANPSSSLSQVVDALRNRLAGFGWSITLGGHYHQRWLQMVPFEGIETGDKRANPSRRLPTRYQPNPAAETRRKAKVRPCITCQIPFQSEGAHNRMCADCRRASHDEPYEAALPNRRGGVA